MTCLFTRPSFGRIRCERCGRERAWDRTDLPRANCPGKPGLGDRVAAVLSRLGFRSCGGCKKRQRWLNRLWRKN